MSSGELPEAVMSSWCPVELVGGDRVLFGFMLRHPVLGALSWMRSTPIVELDEVARRATTASGRRYGLGTRLEVASIPKKGLEARLAYDLLVRADALGECGFDRASQDPWLDRLWLIACKISRNLDVSPPENVRSEIAAFLKAYVLAYVDFRKGQK